MITSAGTKTLTNHYDDDSDSPAWTSTHKVDGTIVVKRYVDGIDGNLDALVNDNGDVKLELTNLHGDTVATIDSDATSITGYHETTEFGIPRDPASADDTYGWLGAKKRSTDDLGGLTLMGVRLYNPVTGRFLSVDPIYGGNANAYTYPDDPINGYDLTGEFCDPDQKCVTSTVTNQPKKTKHTSNVATTKPSHHKATKSSHHKATKSKSTSCNAGCHLKSDGAHLVYDAAGARIITIKDTPKAIEVMKGIISLGADGGKGLGGAGEGIAKEFTNAEESPGWPGKLFSASGWGLLGCGLACPTNHHHD
jgi:RHS repeat-associated protein